jgi:hypothetical protein
MFSVCKCARYQASPRESHLKATNEFEMSMIGELSYFLGLQIKQMKNDTFVSQGKYIKDMIKKFVLQDAKPMSTPMGTNDQLGIDASRNMVD